MSRRLEARVRRDFAPETADAVLARLTTLRLARAEKQSLERIQAAVVLGSNGDFARFERVAALAERDWRDALVSGGLAHGDWPGRLDELLGPRA